MKAVQLVKRWQFLIWIILPGSILLSCSEQPKQKTKNSSLKTGHPDPVIKYHQLDKLFVIGNFTGDKENDTLFQHMYSNLTRAEIDSSANPFQQDWEEVIDWFYKQEVEMYLTLKGVDDTLDLGIAHGLYCLINIGDINSDGKDEIALAIDYLDFSNVNSCRIYSFCDNHWKLLKQFGIHEDAFFYEGDKFPVFKEIKDYLEKQNHQWVFMDYLNDGYDSPEEVGKMKLLELSKCN